MFIIHILLIKVFKSEKGLEKLWDFCLNWIENRNGTIESKTSIYEWLQVIKDEKRFQELRPLIEKNIDSILEDFSKFYSNDKTLKEKIVKFFNKQNSKTIKQKIENEVDKALEDLEEYLRSNIETNSEDFENNNNKDIEKEVTKQKTQT